MSKAMVSSPMSKAMVSSPSSTGGAGTFFEQHVSAYWLAQLLVRGIPPILIDSTVTEVQFQTERLEWNTDDFLVVCEHAGNANRKLVGQVKRKFTVSSSDDECHKAVSDFWKDFKNSTLFSPENDRLVLVTLRGANTLLESFSALLDCARAAHTAADFDQRISKTGVISEKAKSYLNEINTIVSDCEATPIGTAAIWPFLRVLHVLSLDLDSSTSQTEALIKSLLAYTATTADGLHSASESWNELLPFASDAMKKACCIHREDLPKSLIGRHSSIGHNDHQVLAQLKAHSIPVLEYIHSEIGPLHLPRETQLQKVIDAVEESQVILIAGPAGCGKSAIAKDALKILERDHFAFCFRAEEFAKPHIDETLHVASASVNSVQLKSVLAAQGQKVLLVESIERLLEKPSREAFSDLLSWANDDAGLKIILTCRDYSLEIVRSSFLGYLKAKHVLVRVLPLDDVELRQVVEANPALNAPLGNPKLRNVLRNPFFLEKALHVFSNSPDLQLPENERGLRKLFWKEIIRADHLGLAQAEKRGVAFQQIAVKRAQALSQYVQCQDLDTAAVTALRIDGLVVSSPDSQSLLSTAHDVLEDWAILEWLDERYLIVEKVVRELPNIVGLQPAIRRCFRKWVGELVACKPAEAEPLFQAVLTDSSLGSQFCDDTLVAFLLAPSSSEFLTRHVRLLLKDDRALLIRVIRLLRVACMKASEWMPDVEAKGSIFSVPDGTAWATVIDMVHTNLDAFKPKDCQLLLGLIEDAVSDVKRLDELEPDEARNIVDIAYWILEKLPEYRDDKQRHRALLVILTIPQANPGKFETALIGKAEKEEYRDQLSEDLRKLIYADKYGVAASREFPDLVISVAEEYLLTTESDIQEKGIFSYSSHGEMELHFGIKEAHSFGFHPASALHGPWFHLLCFHPGKALAFYFRVFNHSIDWYVHPRVGNDLEPAEAVELTFADGTKKKQWANFRLWGLYRDMMTVGPYVLQSMLMALERWLLQFAEKYPRTIDTLLLNILRNSDSAMLSAAVASVAIAHRNASVEALLVLLSAREYILLDKPRLSSERQGMFSPFLQPEEKLYEDERGKANKLPHRQQDLEAAVLLLQFGPIAPRVQAIIDKHLAELPPENEQTEEDRIWRLALNRMDLRKRKVSIVDASIDDAQAPAGKTQQLIRLDPKPLDPDLQVIIEKNEAKRAQANHDLGLLMWGYNVFQNKPEADPSEWSKQLAEARSWARKEDSYPGTHGAPGIVAAVCLRDHWDEMSEEEKDWCVDTACTEVMRSANDWSYVTRIQFYDMSADRSCARILPKLLLRDLQKEQSANVQKAVAAAFTHSCDEVRKFAALGMDEEILTSNRGFSLRCINAMATEATLIDRKMEKGRQQGNYETASKQVATYIRETFWKNHAFLDDAFLTLDIDQGAAGTAFTYILHILGCLPTDPLTIAAYERASDALVRSWELADKRDYSQHRNHKQESTITKLLAAFLVRTTTDNTRKVIAPILARINYNPHELSWIMREILFYQDSNPNTTQYWFLWEQFAETIKKSSWISKLNNKNTDERELLCAVFHGLDCWKKGVRHWRFLDGYAQLIHDLFNSLPATSVILDSYVRFLYNIGEKSMPDAFKNISGALQRGTPADMLKMSNTVYMLEALLQRHVYTRPMELKSKPDVRKAVFNILDCLVEADSSAAFRMRDDFVTPVIVPVDAVPNP